MLFPFLVLDREVYCVDCLTLMSYDSRSMQFPLTRMILKNLCTGIRRSAM